MLYFFIGFISAIALIAFAIGRLLDDVDKRDAQDIESKYNEFKKRKLK